MNYKQNEVNKLSENEKAICNLLDKMIDELYDAHVDVSYFPEEAEAILIEYAKKIVALGKEVNKMLIIKDGIVSAKTSISDREKILIFHTDGLGTFCGFVIVPADKVDSIRLALNIGLAYQTHEAYGIHATTSPIAEQK